jgi:SAM-dependent MidA family methyltransferase
MNKQLINLIRTEGTISFARYMELALYAPGLGYYSAGLQKFGIDGDFVTAPEISPLFGRCLARQCEQILHELNSPADIPADILELGAGSGKMAADILNELAARDALPNRYYILEVSAYLKQRQQETLQQYPDLYSRVQWLSALPAVPFTGIILANEVLDALPVHRFRIANNKILEAYVKWKNNQFAWQYDEPTSPSFPRTLSLPDGYTSEIHLTIPPLIHSLSNMLKQGAMIFIDYGFPRHEYYHPERNQGTLMCHFRHQAHPDPLINTGLQDITAHIDFTALAEAAMDAKLRVSGYTNQAAFLLGCGLMEMGNGVSDLKQQLSISQHIQKLTQPHEMGELFKVMALTKNLDMALMGFSLYDQRQKLL